MDYRQKLREKLGIFYNEEEEDFHDEYTDTEDVIEEPEIDGGEFEEDASLKSLSDRLQQRFYQGSLRETEIEPEGMEEPVEPMDGEGDEDADFDSDLPPIDSDDDTMSGEMETGDGETVDMEITPEQKKLENSQKIAEKMLDEIMKPIRREANEIEESDINNGMMLRKFYEYVYTNKDKIASFMSKGIK